MTSKAPGELSPRFDLGGGRTVARLGYGAMQITGPGVWGPPADPDEARRVLRRALELGVDLIDTADSYGPAVSEELIAEALHPYPDHLVIATKAGFARTGPGQWEVLGFPEYLTQQCELSLRRLRLERIELFQLHRIDGRVPLADQLGALVDLQAQGKIGRIGLSEVTVSQLQAALEITPIATVQNLYNLSNRTSEPLLQECERQGIGFLPWFPIHTGDLAEPGGQLVEIAGQTGHTPAQLALAWLLAQPLDVVPIPGTKRISFVRQNIAATDVAISADEVALLAEIFAPGRIAGERYAPVHARTIR